MISEEESKKTAISPSFSVAGLTVVVTAGGQGIGRAVAQGFAASGAHVATCDIDANLLDSLQDTPDIFTGVADVSDSDQIKTFFQSVVEQIGPVDVLINNAGIGGARGAIEDITDDDWGRAMAVNLNGMFYTVREVIPHMKRQRKGCIVNISTGSVRTGLPMRTPYVASKAGVMGLTHNIARELGPFNIRCNAILPGLMNNPRGHALIQRAADEQGATFEQVETEILKFISMRTWIEPSEIADTAIFLASAAGRHISGQFLGVCGHVEWEG